MSKPQKDIDASKLVRSRQFAHYLLRTLLRQEPPKYGGTRSLGDRKVGIILSSGKLEGDKPRQLGAKLTNVTQEFLFSDIAKWLGNFRKYRLKNDEIKEDKRPVSIKHIPKPTKAQLLRAFQIATRLNPTERDALDLPEYSQHPLLQEAIINLMTMPVAKGRLLPDAYLDVYQRSRRTEPPPKRALNSFADIEVYLAEKAEEEPDDELDRKSILNVLQRLLLQVGAGGEVRYIDLNDQDRYIANYIGSQFIDRLCEIVIHNRDLRKKLPIYLEHFTFDSYGPFPFHQLSDQPSDSLLSKHWLEKNNAQRSENHALIDEQLGQLPSRTVRQVTAHFHLRVSDRSLFYDDRGNYKGFDESIFNALSSESEGKLYLHFSVSTTGIGGTNALITRVLNLALLGDVQCFQKDYFPVFHDLTVKQENFNQRVLSFVQNHSFVQLCTRRSIQTALLMSGRPVDDTLPRIANYQAYCGHDIKGSGNYIDSDMVMGAANAGLLARLEAISNTDVDADTYLVDLVSKVEQHHCFEKAKKLLIGYPFSCYAMKSWLDTNLIDRYERTAIEGVSRESTVFYATQLLAAEIFITEGSYRNAYEYLFNVHTAFSKPSETVMTWLKGYGKSAPLRFEDIPLEEGNDNIEVISGQVLARYELCMARYLLVLDLEENNNKYFLGLREDATPEDLAIKAWEHLTRAEKHLTLRLVKYHIIDEISQATFKPHYRILSQIYAYRARLFLFYPTLVAPRRSDYSPATQDPQISKEDSRHAAAGRLYLMERARLFSACHGGLIRYNNYTAYQCRFWLMTAYSSAAGTEEIGFSSTECMHWAEQLRNHALLHYKATGRHAYYAIKEKSGLEGKLKTSDYGRTRVESICTIRETRDEEPGYEKIGNQSVLTLDMRYLAVKRGCVDVDTPESTETIYLFGPETCHLFFIRGLYFLCSNQAKEFQPMELSKDGEELVSSELDLADWRYKFEHSYRLLTYAWAIAGDGCGIEDVGSDETQDEIDRRITRCDYKGPDFVPSERRDRHAESVWNLYPFRISEIAELGKVFAAACAALRCYTDEDRAERLAEMNDLLNSLPGGVNYQVNAQLIKSMKDQQRMNSHLIGYFRRCADVIRKSAKVSENNIFNSQRIGSAREELLKELFALNAMS